MPRGRILSPEFWTDSSIVRLSPFARLFYMGMWNHAYCDRGHLWDDPFDLKLKILPADQIDAAELLTELVAAGRVIRESVADRKYLVIPTFLRWQKADDARFVRKCPICQLTSSHGSALPSTTEHYNSHTRRGGERNGVEEEGSTRGARPSRYCPKHPQGTDSGCFACRDARIAQQEWDEAKKNKPTPTPGAFTRPQDCDHPARQVLDGYCSKCMGRVP